MEVLSARMAPAFKGDDSWKYKRVFESKHARQAEAKVDPRSDTALHYESVPLRESGHRKVNPGGPSGWEGGRRPLVGRSVARPPLETVKIENGYSRKVEKPQESSEDGETSEDAQPDDSENSGDDEPAVRDEFTEARQKWPIIQIVDPPPWLPEGWTAVLRTRESGSKDKYYVDPVSQRRFRSKTEVNYFLQTGKSYRYKRNLALLTKPLKEDPVSLPNTGSGRSASLDAPTSGGDAIYGSPSRGYGVVAPGSVRSAAVHASDFRSGLLPTHADIMPRKAYNKPGPKAKVKTFGEEESGRLGPGLLARRNAIDERKAAMEDPQVRSIENRGKLILKLKRKSSEHDDGQRDGKKLRPFEVVGPTPMAQARSISSTSDEDDRRHKNSRGVDLAGESSFRSSVSHSLVPSTHVSKRPMSKAPLAPWHFQAQASLFGRPPFGAAGHLTSGGANGQGILERTSGSATMTTDAEAAKASAKRESPAEQLQRLGRKLCQQAVYVLACEYPGMNTLEEVSLALHAAVSNRPASHGLTANFNRMFNPAFNTGFQALPPALPSAPYHHAPLTGRMRGSSMKEKGLVPIQKFAMDHEYLLAPQAQRE